jgi:circadian clock protein KaiB
MASNGSSKKQLNKRAERSAAQRVKALTQEPPAAAWKDGKGSGKLRSAAQDEDTWTLRLYVAGDSPKSQAAISNLKRLCETHLAGKYEIEVIDLKLRPELAKAHQILALPTLIRRVPEPVRRVIGDLSNADRTLVGLDIAEARA